MTTDSGKLPSGRAKPRNRAWGGLIPAVLATISGPGLHSAEIYVNALATGANNGTSWSNAFTSLQSALAIAVSGDQVWIAQGRYVPGSSRSSYFAVPNGVSLYGGFIGNESSLGSRAWQTHRAILSGDINGDDNGFTNNSENCYNILQPGNGSTVDGVIISGANCNTSSIESGAIAAPGISSSPQFTNVTISNCMFAFNSGQYAGAISSTDASNNIDHCVFISNRTTDPSGAGAAISGEIGAVTNSIFTNNTAGGDGGSIYLSFVMNTTTLWNDVFVGNTAGGNGGAITVSYPGTGTNLSVTHCTWFNNHATGYGGALAQEVASNAGTVTIQGSVLIANTAGTASADEVGTNNSTTASLVVTDCAADGGLDSTTSSIISSTPTFINTSSVAGSDGLYFSTDDGFMPIAGSSIIGQDPSNSVGVDICGTSRPQGPASTLGAYEYIPGGGTTAGASSGTGSTTTTTTGTATGSSTGSAGTTASGTGGASSGGSGGCGVGGGVALILGLFMFSRRTRR